MSAASLMSLLREGEILTARFHGKGREAVEYQAVVRGGRINDEFKSVCAFACAMARRHWGDGKDHVPSTNRSCFVVREGVRLSLHDLKQAAAAAAAAAAPVVAAVAAVAAPPPPPLLVSIEDQLAAALAAARLEIAGLRAWAAALPPPPPAVAVEVENLD